VSATTPNESAAGRSSLERLRALLLDEGGLMASLAKAVPGAGNSGATTAAAGSGPAQLAGAGPRAEGQRDAYELLVETIYEGYLLHYGAPRVAFAPEADLGLLAGDRLYALGLARLVELGDIEAVAELADTISLSALAQSTDSPMLADAVWIAGARAVGWGSSAAHRNAKDLVLAGDADAIEAMRTICDGPPSTPSASP
jgi:hypothetical protein